MASHNFFWPKLFVTTFSRCRKNVAYVGNFSRGLKKYGRCFANQWNSGFVIDIERHVSKYIKKLFNLYDLRVRRLRPTAVLNGL